MCATFNQESQKHQLSVNKYNYMKDAYLALAGVAQWIKHQPAD